MSLVKQQMNDLELTSIQHYKSLKSSKDKYQNNYKQSNSNNIVNSNVCKQNKQVKSQLNCQNQTPNILQKIYDQDQCSTNIKRNKQNKVHEQQINNSLIIIKKENAKTDQSNIELTKQSNETFRDYKQVLLFNNKFTKVTIQYNQDKKQTTVKKYFKENNFKSFIKEIEILQKMVNDQITLPLISHSENNDLWYEQIAGLKDFLILTKHQPDDVEESFFYGRIQFEYLQNLKILFCKLFKKQDRMFELGYAHSDIKPPNIVLGYDFEPYFIDFGSSVELKDFKEYLNQFTPQYNHSKYIKKNKETNDYITYNFQNEKEIIQCDRTQLIISFLNMIIQIIKKYFIKNKIFENINLLNQYFKEKKFNKLIQILGGKKLEHEKFRNLQRQVAYLIDNEIINILNLIEQPDNYDQMKKQIYNISERNVNSFIFSDIQSPNILKRINQYSINIIKVYVDQFGELEIKINQKNDLLWAENSLEHRILYNISKAFENNRDQKIFVKKESNTNRLVYFTPSTEYHFNNFEFERDDLNKIKSIEDLNYSFHKDSTLRNIYQISEQFKNITESLKQNKQENILVESFTILQNKKLHFIQRDMSKYFYSINQVFNCNKFIIKIYKTDFINDKLFDEVYDYSNNDTEFKLVFIDCRFKEELVIKIHKFIKSYQKYNILYSYQDKFDITKSSVSYHSSAYQKIDEITQKQFIKLQFVDSKLIVEEKYYNSQNYNQMSLKNYEKHKNFINLTPFYFLISQKEIYYLQKHLKKFFSTLKYNTHLNFLNKIQQDNISVLICDNDIFSYFLDKCFEGQIILLEKIFGNFEILNINDIEYLIISSTKIELKQYFLNICDRNFEKYFNFNDDQKNEKILIISILRQNIKRQFGKLNCEKSHDLQNKIIKLKSLFPNLVTKKKYCIEELDLSELILKTIQLRYQFCLDLNNLLYSQVELNQQRTYEQFQIKDYIREYKNLRSKYSEIFYKYFVIQLENYNRILKKYLGEQQKQEQFIFQSYYQFCSDLFNSKFNLYLFKEQFSDQFQIEEEYLFNLLKQKLREDDTFLSGQSLCEQFKLKYNLEIDYKYD